MGGLPKKTSSLVLTPEHDPDQAGRRARILKAVLQLASEGGYDAVQLRDVSARSGVALKTIYKYYGSRSALLGAAMAQWQLRVIEECMAQTRGATFADRMASRYKHMFETFRKRPKLFDALAGLQREGGGVQSFGAKRVGPDPEFEGLDPDFHLDFVIMVGSTLYSTLHFCVYGGLSFKEGWTIIDRAIRRLSPEQDRSLRSPRRRSARRA